MWATPEARDEPTPENLGAAMLAGVLLQFGLKGFSGMESQFVLVGAMFATYLVARRFLPRYAIPAVLLVGTVGAVLGGQFHLASLPLELTTPCS